MAGPNAKAAIGLAALLILALVTTPWIAPVTEPRPALAPIAAPTQIENERRISVTPDPADGHAVSSVLNVPKAMHYGQYLWDDQGIAPGPAWVRVDLDAQIISVFRTGHEIGTAVILYGADSKPTPTGRFPILAKLKDHRSSIYEAKMPYTLRLTNDGVAIHGSDVRRGLATHGCIGIPEAFAAKLFGEMQKGGEVVIVRAGATVKT